MTTLGYITMMLIAVLILTGLLVKGVESDANNCDKKVRNKDMLDRMVEEDLEAFNAEMKANKDKRPKVDVDVDNVIGNVSYLQTEVPQFVEVKGDDSVTFPIPEELKVKLDLLDLPKASNAHTSEEICNKLKEVKLIKPDYGQIPPVSVTVNKAGARYHIRQAAKSDDLNLLRYEYMLHRDNTLRDEHGTERELTYEEKKEADIARRLQAAANAMSQSK